MTVANQCGFADGCDAQTDPSTLKPTLSIHPTRSSVLSTAPIYPFNDLVQLVLHDTKVSAGRSGVLMPFLAHSTQPFAASYLELGPYVPAGAARRHAWEKGRVVAVSYRRHCVGEQVGPTCRHGSFR